MGGDLGVAIGGFYTGDSSFTTEPSAGRVGLAVLNDHLFHRGFVVHDTQVLSSLTVRHGGRYVRRGEYEAMLESALKTQVTFS